ncbi:MAG: hypothetical protein KAS73_15880 [Candidatus Sabulitectum sp.]|nr:hypothetical protein [Candidatus Sabulitectum sp.]
MQFFKPFLLLLLFSICSFALPNPFISGGSAEEQQSESSLIRATGGPSTWPVIGSLLTKSTSAQRELQISIANAISDIDETGSMKSLWLLLGVSFIFGVLHALGPGHRKAVLVTYFLGSGTKPVKGFLAGFLLALVHAASAIVLVGGLYLFTTHSLLISVDKAQNILFPVTYAIILILGVWMIIHGIMEYRAIRKSAGKDRGITGLILSGLVPCPAASAIMILSVAGDAVLLGIMSILFMSLGMGVLLATLGLSAVLMRNRITVAMKESDRIKTMELILHLFSGLAMALFGLFMALGFL